MKLTRLTALIVMMIVLATACSGEATPEPAAEPTAAPTEEATEEPAAEPTEAPTEAPAESEAQAGQVNLTDLTANPWQWVSFTNPVEQFDVEMPQSYVITFNEDGTAGVVADCNNASGSYTADASSLTIELGPMTMAACPEDSRSDQFVQLLGGAAIYFFEDGDLFIDLMADGGTMVFSPSFPAEAVGSIEIPTNIIWGLRSISDPVSGETTLDETERYTVSFGEDGLLVLGGDCRVAIGDYEVADGSLALSYDIPEKDDESCEEGPNADRFFTLMQSAVRYTLDDRLRIDLNADGGTFVFDVSLVLEPAETEDFEVQTALTLCGDGASELSEIEVSLDPESVSKLDELILSNLDDRALKPAPGVSLLVITPEGRYFKSVGVADVNTCAPLPADALFEIGSNTKMMTAAVIYQLQEEGVLSTSDLIDQWVPEMAAILPNSDQITIDMLLTHTSGIYDYINGTAEDGPLYAGATDKDVLTQAYEPEELVRLAADSGEPYFEPGAEGQWTYSNTGYVLLGMIIEAATGKTYEENLQERIFEPLGMQNTFLLNGQPEPGLLPQGYLETPFDYTTGEWNLSQGWSAGAVVSDAEDMAVFLKALFSGELFQDPATIDLMLAPARPDFEQFTDNFYYGHGMFYKNGLLGHGGQALGFQSDVGYLPDEDITIVIWGNSAENGLGSGAVHAAEALGLIETE